VIPEVNETIVPLVGEKYILSCRVNDYESVPPGSLPEFLNLDALFLASPGLAESILHELIELLDLLHHVFLLLQQQLLQIPVLILLLYFQLLYFEQLSVLLSPEVPAHHQFLKQLLQSERRVAQEWEFVKD
jgi:hypothetical protein